MEMSNPHKWFNKHASSCMDILIPRIESRARESYTLLRMTQPINSTWIEYSLVKQHTPVKEVHHTEKSVMLGHP